MISIELPSGVHLGILRGYAEYVARFRSEKTIRIDAEDLLSILDRLDDRAPADVMALRRIA